MFILFPPPLSHLSSTSHLHIYVHIDAIRDTANHQTFPLKQDSMKTFVKFLETYFTKALLEDMRVALF